MGDQILENKIHPGHTRWEEARIPQTRMSLTPDDHAEKTHDRYGRNARFAGKGPRSYKRSDASIEDEVCRKLTDDPFVDASGIEITVKDREIILRGTVDSRDTKRRVEDIVESVRGVVHVENRVRAF